MERWWEAMNDQDVRVQSGRILSAAQQTKELAYQLFLTAPVSMIDEAEKVYNGLCYIASITENLYVDAQEKEPAP